jgi:26S proteasome regulatory subunit N8
MASAKPIPADTTVVVHPLVLLSVVDHYNRTCKNTKKRAVGCLLGSWQGKILDVANSFAGRIRTDPAYGERLEGLLFV